MAVTAESRIERIVNSVRQHPEHVLAVASIAESVASVLINLGVLGRGDLFLGTAYEGSSLITLFVAKQAKSVMAGATLVKGSTVRREWPEDPKVQ